MSSAGASGETAAGTPPAKPGEMRLEVVIVPVSDVDRAKAFYERLGWRLDIDLAVAEGYRIVQLTSPGSGCSIHIGEGITAAAPGSYEALVLAVFDLEETLAELGARGVPVSEPFHFEGGRLAENRVPGPDPEGRSYFTWASFSDPDGNDWLLQEIKARLPGR